ncbi:LAGLIDADG family homing endonuclease [Oceanisphaera ostreae]|uniref:LAGLIDADG family homing endonuclease n=1 Tax=Oceanisphaera ostreae TaxID=914151 RepID=A0ABW3KP41_9GAMM
MPKPTKRPWTEEEIELLKKGYKDGTPTQEIAAQLKRTWRSVRGKAHMLSLTHSWRDDLLYSREEDKYIQEHAQEMTMAEIGLVLGRSEGSVYQRGLRLGVAFKNPAKCAKYEKNHTYFNQPTVENSYVAGLLAADGWIKPMNVDKPINQVGIALAEKDLHLLEYIREVTGYTGVIRSFKVKGHSQNELRISGVPQWIEDLNTHWSLTPNKSYTIQPPNEDHLTREQILAYHVGLIEGDGHVRHNNGTLTVSMVTASKDFADWLQYSWEHIAGARPTRCIHQNQTAHYVIFHGRNARRLCSKLMSVGVHRLARKWNIAQSEIDKYS